MVGILTVPMVQCFVYTGVFGMVGISCTGLFVLLDQSIVVRLTDSGII